MIGLRRIKRIANMASICAFAGCAVGPNFSRPSPPNIARYTPPDASDSAGDQRLIIGQKIQAEWWQVFNSPDLNDLITQALKANSDLAAAKAALKAAHENYLAEDGLLLPTADLGAGASRDKGSQYLSSALNNNQFYYTLQTVQLNIGYTLDVFGGLRRQVEGLRAQEDAQRFQTEGVYLTLVTNVVAAALQEASLRSQVAHQNRIITLETQILLIMQRQLNLGQITRSDILLQQAAVMQAQAAVPPLQKQLAVQRDLLAYLTGRSPSQLTVDHLSIDALALPTELPLSLPSSLVDQRPDIRAAEANLHVASADVGVAIAARLPTLTLSGSAGGSSNRWSSLFSHGDDFWSYGAGLTQPLFEGGQLYRRQKSAQASLIQAQALYRSAVLSAFQNTADVLQALEIDGRALDIAVKTERSAEQSLVIARQQLTVGQVSVLVVLSAEQAVQTSQIALVQAKSARLVDIAALFQALGGGWQSRSAPLS